MANHPGFWDYLIDSTSYANGFFNHVGAHLKGHLGSYLTGALVGGITYKMGVPYLSGFRNTVGNYTDKNEIHHITINHSGSEHQEEPNPPPSNAPFRPHINTLLYSIQTDPLICPDEHRFDPETCPVENHFGTIADHSKVEALREWTDAVALHKVIHGTQSIADMTNKTSSTSFGSSYFNLHNSIPTMNVLSIDSFTSVVHSTSVNVSSFLRANLLLIALVSVASFFCLSIAVIWWIMRQFQNFQKQVKQQFQQVQNQVNAKDDLIAKQSTCIGLIKLKTENSEKLCSALIEDRTAANKRADTFATCIKDHAELIRLLSEKTKDVSNSSADDLLSRVKKLEDAQKQLSVLEQYLPLLLQLRKANLPEHVKNLQERVQGLPGRVKDLLECVKDLEVFLDLLNCMKRFEDDQSDIVSTLQGLMNANTDLGSRLASLDRQFSAASNRLFELKGTIEKSQSQLRALKKDRLPSDERSCLVNPANESSTFELSAILKALESAEVVSRLQKLESLNEEATKGLESLSEKANNCLSRLDDLANDNDSRLKVLESHNIEYVIAFLVNLKAAGGLEMPSGLDNLEALKLDEVVAFVKELEDVGVQDLPSRFRELEVPMENTSEKSTEITGQNSATKAADRRTKALEQIKGLTWKNNETASAMQTRFQELTGTKDPEDVAKLDDFEGVAAAAITSMASALNNHEFQIVNLRQRTVMATGPQGPIQSPPYTPTPQRPFLGFGFPPQTGAPGPYGPPQYGPR